MPQLDSFYYASQVFWLIVNFSCMYLVFAKFFLPKFSEVLAKRKLNMDVLVKQRKDLDLKVSALNKEAVEMINESYKVLNEQKRLTVATCENMLKDKIAEFDETIASQKNEAMQKLKTEMKQHDDIDEVVVKYAAVMIFKLQGTELNLPSLFNLYNSIK